jgi:hypothetical protein
MEHMLHAKWMAEVTNDEWWKILDHGRVRRLGEIARSWQEAGRLGKWPVRH